MHYLDIKLRKIAETQKIKNKRFLADVEFKMIWQDMVITLANLLFTYSLIIQVHKGFKDKKAHMHFQTALFTTIGLYAITIAFTSLNLLFSALVSGFNATMWLLLFIQKLIY